MKYPDISKAVEQEILASYEKLYRLAFSYVKNEQDAMDVVQESVYKAMKNASQIKEKKYITIRHSHVLIYFFSLI